MFRRPNTPGRKGRWEPKPGELPPAWFGEKYGGFEDLENNPVFRYMKMLRRFPPPDILRDLLTTPMEPRKIVEAFIAYKNSRIVPEGPWGTLLEFNRISRDQFGGSKHIEFPSLVLVLALTPSMVIPLSGKILAFLRAPEHPAASIVIFLFAWFGTMLLIGILTDQKYTSPTRAYFDRWMDRRLAELEEFRLRTP